MSPSTIQSKDHTVVDGYIRPYNDEGQRDIKTKLEVSISYDILIVRYFLYFYLFIG